MQRTGSIICSSCKEVGHASHECPKDPNARTRNDPIEEIERLQNIKKFKKKSTVQNLVVG